MKNQFELSYKDLKSTCNPNIFKFETTESLEPIASGIGQDRGIKALEFGLNVDINGYNLYIEGPSGVGKTMYTKHYLESISKKKKSFHKIGVMFTTLTIQMSQLLFHLQPVKVKNLEMQWIDLLKI